MDISKIDFIKDSNRKEGVNKKLRNQKNNKFRVTKNCKGLGGKFKKTQKSVRKPSENHQ